MSATCPVARVAQLVDPQAEYKKYAPVLLIGASKTFDL
jgi:hypothetical protein